MSILAVTASKIENRILPIIFWIIQLLHTADKGLKLNALESLKINKRKFDDVLLNDQVDLNSLPLLNLF